MIILIFIIILSVLVFVHEMGHFLFAKMAGVKVEEFGFGYPPRAVKLFRAWGTDFSINWIPFGGFVKIVGENYDEAESLELKAESYGKKFTDVSKKWQATILAAGVLFNILFAWFLLSIGFMVGMPYSAEDQFGSQITDPKLTITSVIPGSPAEMAGLKPGDVIDNFKDPETLSNFVAASQGAVSLQINRGKEALSLNITPKSGLVPDRPAIGVSMDTVGILRLPFFQALIYAAQTTWNILIAIFEGILSLIGGLFVGHADLSQVAGPVGIISIVGDAARLGLIYILSFTVAISLNLAIVNLIPFPALDGGRILFVFIEYLKGSRISPKIFNTVNTIGFFILIGLMVLVTFHDITKLF